jgi:hypothetical protein
MFYGAVPCRQAEAKLAALCLWVICLCAVCVGAHAQTAPAVTVRFAVHDHFDRLVFTLPPDAEFSSSQDGAVLKLRIIGAGPIAATGANGDRMLGFEGGSGEVSIHLAPNTHPHIWRLDKRLVVDVAEGPGGAADVTAAPAPDVPHVHTLQARTLQAGPTKLAPAPKLALVLPVLAENLSPAAPEPQPAPAAAPDPAPKRLDAAAGAAAPWSGPMDVGQVGQAPSRAAVILLPQNPASGPGFLAPFGKDIAAAAFLRAGEAHVVFDTPTALDLGQLKDDPAFGAMTERLLANGVHLRMPLAAGAALLLAHRPDGWSVNLVHGLPQPAPIIGHGEHGVLSFAVVAPGHVLVLDDETTGGKLLVGTQRSGGQSMPAFHRSAEFTVLPSWLGVVVAPLADRIALTPVPAGFRLAAANGPDLSLHWADEAGHVMTRRFDLRDLPPSVLQNRLTLAQRDAALTPHLARFPARLRVAQAMLAEGLDVEARAVLHVATADDPAHADDADAAGLSAIASWLIARAGGGKAPPPDGFDPAVLGDSDEAQFWRALFKAGQPDFAEPAAALAVTWPLLQQYPPELRRRIAPSVGDSLERGKQDKALAAFLAAFPDASLDLVRADFLRRQGKTAEALALFDAVARRPDRLMRASALREAVETRLAAHMIDVPTAAAALGKQLFAWRGGPSDLALRLRVADLRAQAGLWRPALALLRETDALFPDSHAQVQAAESQIISALLHGDSATKLSALDLVALAEEAAPLLSAADADVTLAPVLVDKLLALDLPARAEPILRRLFDHAASPVQKAELGVRLAGLVADRGDAKEALAVLDASDDSGLAIALVAQRGVLRARILAASGRATEALGILSGVHGDLAIELQAKILEDRHDWAAAAKLLETLMDAPDFAARPEQAKRELILRLANDESEAGDMAALRRLRGAQAARFATGPGAELFAVLTQEPIQALDDLPRAGRELQAVRALPASLATH